jgi:hypothetical protein
MSDYGKQKPRGPAGRATTAAEHRRDRLAEELRANLRKRKALARKRQGNEGAIEEAGETDGA